MSSQHQQQSQPHSPDMLPTHLQSPVMNDTYGMQMGSANNSQSLYNRFQMPPDLTPTPTDHDEAKQRVKTNGFSNGPYRVPTGFSGFSNTRNGNSSIVPGPGSAFHDAALTDIFAPTQPPLQQHMSPTQTSLPSGFDSLQHQARIDFRGSQLTSPFSGVNPKPTFNNVDPFGTSSTLLQSHQVSKAGVIASTQVSQQPSHLHSQHQHNAYHTASQMGGYSNGLTMHSQTPFGPHLPTNGMSAPAAPVSSGPSMNHVNGGSASGTSQEEISTIFVVGFPDDMSEREFQNMFTFCNGFEAATLKIPNKESTAYGSGNGLSRGGNLQYQSYAGQNDPYNLVTVNQGGVVVDGGRDGTTSSWPATIPDDSHFVHNAPAQPPRKQIIGFAKFRTRDEALAARDQLQGRRVDIEKGAVLKAEMAKKNLHTKRGVGPLGGPSSATAGGGGGGGSMGADGLGYGDQLGSRDRDTLAAMGLRRESRLLGGDRDDEDRHRTREREMSISMGLGSLGTRGPRERVEEDERERERRRKEARLRSSNTNAFDAFHSVPAGRLASGAEGNGFGLHTQPSMPNLSSYESLTSAAGASPWGSAGVFRKQSVPILTNAPIRPPSTGPQSSGTDPTYPLSVGPLSASSVMSDKDLPNNLLNSGPPLSPPVGTSTLPSHPSLPSRPRPYSPSADSHDQPHVFGMVGQMTSSSVPPSSASSMSGSQVSDGEISRSMVGLTMGGSQGSTSPQLPSPASGASSGTRGNPGDQNPPINTLYVGNLPTSPMPAGYPPNFLEESLRELFSRRPGYRKLCFRQKSNGPMCFVEFEDVQYATKALNELYGHALGGLIKGGGIRLSYSKNPLGVRTSTSANGNHQQQAGAGHYSSQVPSAFAEPFQPRQPQPTYIDSDLSRTIRRDNSGLTSPTYHYTVPSPPRFFSPSPSSQFDQQATTAAYPRGNAQGYTSSTFSPFALSPSPHPIPEQSSAETHHEHFPHTLSHQTSSSNLETGRAG
ncbi:hypothetical protein NEOLEDRAFT_1153943 [Neolentinus lepideus HHB14362 ss-1]|uniref:RRM domain-containing protein n=1 Tax=Neolentinus lepideus HHB14362 ss-1 TaxID=1314782 RepID=A0A165VAX8_9AGAM|nr:hypothetical protein NEOLEDRAFT_1153943 [Neolentinus lepideus HHB14362 ss-1]